MQPKGGLATYIHGASPTGGLSAIGGPGFGISSGAAFPEGTRQLFFLCSRRSLMVPGMPDLPEKLSPVRREDLVATLAFALTRDGRLAKAQAAELTASIVAERIIDRLGSLSE